MTHSIVPKPLCTTVCIALTCINLTWSCTNYSGSRANQAPPILISATAIQPNSYKMEARAQNPEILFQGYRLYAGGNEKESRNPVNLNLGIDCFGGIAQIPNQPLAYTFQIDPVSGPPTEGAICRFVADLPPGTFVTIRSLLLSLNVTSGGIILEPSGPSNTLVLPAFSPPTSSPDP